MFHTVHIQMSLGQMSLGQMSLGQMSLGQMSLGGKGGSVRDWIGGWGTPNTVLRIGENMVDAERGIRGGRGVWSSLNTACAYASAADGSLA